jgi:hypothetical protein
VGVHRRVTTLGGVAAAVIVRLNLTLLALG